MKMKSISVSNFRGIESLELEFHPKMTVLAGENGAGKSSIIDSASILMSWFIGRLKSENGRGENIDDFDIRNGSTSSELKIECYSEMRKEVAWSIAKAKSGSVKGKKSELADLTAFSRSIQSKLTYEPENTVLPIIAFFPVARAVLDIPLRIRNQHNFNRLDAYESSLKSSANFREFFEWYRNREDFENEMKVENGDLSLRDAQLSAVRSAIKNFMDGFSNLSVKRNPLRMVIRKNGQELRVNQLSIGEKCLLAMVGDLARRLAIANPNAEKPLEGPGIVFVDEIDLHLHPKWQRNIVRKLTTVFPNCQFVVSTHSPQILSEVEAEQIRLLRNIEGKVAVSQPSISKGLDSSEVLEILMGAESQAEDVVAKFHEIYRLIDKEDFAAAESKIEALRNELGSDIPEITKASTMLMLMKGE